jgi:hypothetical protein
MGRDLGRAVPMRRPAPLTGTRPVGATLAALLMALLAAVVTGLVTAGPASAADPTPTPDPFATEVSTPSLSPPSQQQIDDAKAALQRLRDQRKPTPAPLQQVSGPATRAEGASVVSQISDQAWWTIGAGLLVLLVASETTRLSVRRAKHRKGA